MILNGYKKTQTDFYGNGVQTYEMSSTGGVGQAVSIPGKPFVIETKNGAAIFMHTFRRNNLAAQRIAAINAGCTLYTIAARVYIDVNGKNGPNVFRRDIFFFALGENGVLYPHGGRDNNRINGGGLWTSNSGYLACTDDYKGNMTGARGAGCTARVIEEGYKINY